MNITPEIITEPDYSLDKKHPWSLPRLVLNYLSILEEHPALFLDRVFKAGKLELVALSGNEPLALMIVTELQKKIDLLMRQETPESPTTRFADGEVRPVFDPKTVLRGKHVIILQSFSPAWKSGDSSINDQVVELILACQQAKAASASEITVVMPYLAYARSDKKDMPKGGIAIKAILTAIEAQGVTRFVSIDLHKDQIAGFAQIFDVLYSSEIFIPRIKQLLAGRSAVFVCADPGAIHMVQAYSARTLGHKTVGVVSKSRDPETGMSRTDNYSGPDLTGKIVIFVDDLIGSASTAVEAANLIATKGVTRDDVGTPEIYFVASHGLFVKNALSLIKDSAIKQVWTTNTISHQPEVYDQTATGGKIVVFNIAAFLAEKILNVHTGRPMGID